MKILLYDETEDIKKFDRMIRMSDIVIKKENGCLKIEKNIFMIEEREILDMLKDENVESIGKVGDLKTIGNNMDNPKIENILKLNEYELINELSIPRTIKEIIYKINEIIEYINKEEK